MIPGLRRSPGGGHGNPLYDSCPENPHGQRSLAGYSPRSRKESDTTEELTHFPPCLPYSKETNLTKGVIWICIYHHNILKARVLPIDARSLVPLNFYCLPVLAFCYLEYRPWATRVTISWKLANSAISRSYQRPIESEDLLCLSTLEFNVLSLMRLSTLEFNTVILV